jgi:hypothetical protein
MSSILNGGEPGAGLGLNEGSAICYIYILFIACEGATCKYLSILNMYMSTPHKPTEEEQFRALLDQTLDSNPYADKDKTLHLIWCMGFLKELVARSRSIEIRNHLLNTLDRFKDKN